MEERFTEALEELKTRIVSDYARRLFRDGEETPHRCQMFEEFVNELHMEEGRKYLKIITRNSVWGFIMMKDDTKFVAGDILKAASWHAPARNAARGNIFNENYAIQWTGPMYLV